METKADLKEAISSVGIELSINKEMIRRPSSLEK